MFVGVRHVSKWARNTTVERTPWLNYIYIPKHIRSHTFHSHHDLLFPFGSSAALRWSQVPLTAYLSLTHPSVRSVARRGSHIPARTVSIWMKGRRNFVVPVASPEVIYGCGQFQLLLLNDIVPTEYARIQPTATNIRMPCKTTMDIKTHTHIQIFSGSITYSKHTRTTLHISNHIVHGRCLCVSLVTERISYRSSGVMK